MVEKAFYKSSEAEFQDEYLDMYPETIGLDSSPVKNVTFVVTGACNMACTYCYQKNKNTDKMTFEQGKKIIDLLFEQDLANSRFVNPDLANGLILDFIGGEPLLEVDLIDQILRYFRWKAIKLRHRWALRYMISISSNGTLYETKKVQNFLFKNLGRLSLTITVDGNKELHDLCRVFPDGAPTYDIVESAIKKYRKVVNPLYTKLTLAPANVHYLSSAMKNLKEELLMDGVYANCVYEEGWTTKEAKILYEEMKKVADWMLDNDYEKTFFCTLFDLQVGEPLPEDNLDVYCGGDARMLSFTPDGKIQPCQRFSQMSLGCSAPQLDIGDIETGIGETPSYQKILDGLNSIDRRSISDDKCFNCPIASGCGYCVAYNYEVFGTPNSRATFICVMHQARVLANAYYWNKLYKKNDLPTRFKLNIPDEWALEIVSRDELDKIKKDSF